MSSESLFRTTKYRPDYPAHGFNDLVAAREWMLNFVNGYNNEHCHSAIKFVTPAERHRNLLNYLEKHRYVSFLISSLLS